MGFICCTVASRRFLAHATVLADSFFEHHPDGQFVVLVPDDPEGTASAGERMEILRPADVGVPSDELARMALMYKIRELACALKGRLLRHLVDRGEPVVLLDGDVCVYGDLTPLAQLAQREQLVLSTHSHTPHHTPDRYPPMAGYAPRLVNALGADQMILLAGTFNTGLMALTSAATDFLEWWNRRTARYCLLEPGRGLFQEQGWTTLAPTLFPCHILREPGWNVSGFHLHDDDVAWEGGRPTISGAPLRCFHFITFDPAAPEQMSSEAHIRGVWPPPAERPGALRVYRDYAERLRAAGYQEAMAGTSPYDRLPDGTPVDRYMRVAYGEALLRHEAGRGPEPPNPFLDGDGDGFLRWLEEPEPGASEGAPVSRYLAGIHTALDWVYGPFKAVPGADAERYLAWLLAAVDRGDLAVPERWLPPRPPDGSGTNPDLVELERRYRELLGAMEAVTTSRSWRFTAPLRRAGELVRDRRTRLPSP